MRTHRLAAMSRLISINIENNQFIKLLQQIVKDHLKVFNPSKLASDAIQSDKVSWEIPYLFYFP